MPQAIRVFHCDDSPAFTRLVRHWLLDYEGLEHAGAAHTGPEALAMLQEADVDVVLVDTMGSPGDCSLLDGIREVAPQARVIVYSGYVNLLESGALGCDPDAYLEKGEDEETLVAAIREVAARRS